MGYSCLDLLAAILLVPIQSRQVVTNAITDVDKQNFLKKKLKTVGGIHIEEEINKSGHEKCMKRVGGIDKRGRN